MNLWHALEPGADPPAKIYVVVEIPKGSRNKFEYSKDLGVMKLDRVLFSSIHYPGDYGFIPRTYFDDGDPLDVLVMTNEPTFPGCVIEAHPIGVFRLADREEPDDKILAVPARDPLFESFRDIEDIPQHFLREVTHFFEVYKDLEGLRTEGKGWDGLESAHKVVRRSIEVYRTKFMKGQHI